MVEPQAERPYMPYYGIHEDLEGVLPWSWAEERLRDTRTYFLATTRADGRPHVMPLWAVWVHDSLCLSTAKTTVKSHNLERDPRCVVSAERHRQHIVLEGTAVLTELIDVPDFTATYKEKYEETIDQGPIWRVMPTVVFAFIETTEDFAKTATRWTF
jgi:hypothetical protein